MKQMLLVMMLFSTVNFTFAYDGWSTGKIEKICYQGHQTLINQSGAANPNGCDSANYIVLKEDTSEFSKRDGSALLAAQMSGTTVSLALTGCFQGGKVAYPLITEVWITNN
jgi:hypothetical protein